jgi:hypothetical protein
MMQTFACVLMASLVHTTMQTNGIQTNDCKLFACRLMAPLIHTTMQTNGMRINDSELFDMQTNGTISSHFYAN